MRRLLLLQLAASTALFAGCGGGPPEISGGGSDTPSPTSASTAETTSSTPETSASTPTGSSDTGPPGGSGGAPDAPAKVDPADYKKADGGLQYAILKPGSGPEAKKGDQVEMHYTGWLKDSGFKFDSSLDRGQTYPFTLGAGRVIKGWDLGVQGMKPGERRQLVIPAELGYGDRGTPDGQIPPGATLVFDVELVQIGG